MKPNKGAHKIAFFIIFFYLSTTVVFSKSHQIASDSGRTVRTIDSNWRFIRQDVSNAGDPGLDDRTWQIVSLPHTWNRKDSFDDTRGYYRGPAWYRKKIKIGEGFSGKQIFLKFGAVNQVADIYVNGHHVLKHEGGYTAFAADITPYVHLGEENLIAVRADNSYNQFIPPLSADFTFMGGIYRKVWLISTSPVHITVADFASPGVFIHTTDVSDKSTTVVTRSQIVNNSDKKVKASLETVITDEDGRTIQQMSSHVTIDAGQPVMVSQRSPEIKNPHLWSPDDPYLYTVTTNVIEDGTVVDSETNPLGIRWYRFDPDKGFFLNGRHLKLKGVDRHQFYPGFGNAVPDRYQVADMKMIKEMGGNFVRLAHYPQDPSVLEAADHLGILVWQEIPVVNTIDTSATFTANASHMLREMIHQYYNYPSIILWGYMNEILLVPPHYAGRDHPAERKEYFRKVVELAKHLNSIAHREDPTRETAMAMHHSSLYDQTGLSGVPDVAGWNLYQGWYEPMKDKSGKNLFGKYLDEQHAKYPKRVMIISEYGAGSDSRIHTTDPQQFDFSTEYQNYYHEQILNQIDERPFIAGSAAWVMFDFPSEGRNDTRPWINEKGLVNEDRTPKEIYYFYKSRFSDQPVLRIASRDWTERTVPFKKRDQKLFNEPVTLFSNSGSVTLWVDGRSIGRKNPGNKDYVNWSVPMSIGANHLVAQGRRNGKNYSDDLTINLSYRGDFYGGKGSNAQLLVDAGSHYQFYPKRGVIWEADQPKTGNDWGYDGGKPGHTSANILDTSDDPVYQNYREGMSDYHFEVPPGAYTVTIYLAEPDFGISGKRVFSISVNGQNLFDNTDLAKTYGKDVPVSKAIHVDVKNNDGITIAFTAAKGKTLVNGISIRKR
ncbi:MAG TPA: glycoside hydrolase family 2 TIM barrel-domain containing protein [Balneolales bacterium]|nr:glycoside hydrolase family 2 TIM barrel-domain containing protein [Balneolales bacterium]